MATEFKVCIDKGEDFAVKSAVFSVIRGDTADSVYRLIKWFAVHYPIETEEAVSRCYNDYCE